MYKGFTIICISLCLFLTNTKSVKSDVDPKDSICRVKKLPASAMYDQRAIKLQKFLIKHSSPLAPYSGRLVYWADYYKVDWRLVAAISGVESTFGKHMPRNSYNAYGWNNGEYKFTSWEDSIEHVTKTLRLKYLDKGATNIYQIARRYAPPSTTWAHNVSSFMAKIDSAPVELEL